MGSTGSRPKLFKVAPCNSLQEGALPEPQWTVPALPTLQPLALQIGHTSIATQIAMVIKKKRNIWLLCQRHCPHDISRHNEKCFCLLQGRDCRDGGVPLSSTIGQTGHCGTSRMIQGGFLEAQTALTQQAHRQRRAHHRQAREQRRHKVIYSVNGKIANCYSKKKA
ncbi:hypothetical protein F7725_007989 [Dissostichus mawsoni]|uniref:Uncharacterized protein n=1 Tax=Dissostichus mawsoni TaxID=36200 RepID=A0A7J5Y5V9_DISMA|nr:hypothetical protein F7725_007989 [Dissostichus mawsoni]